MPSPARLSLTGATLALALSASGPNTPAAAQDRVACAEGAPCWTWPTMGNHRRGVIVGGQRFIVTPCGYRTLKRAGLLDASTPRLRGDYTATTRKCL